MHYNRNNEIKYYNRINWQLFVHTIRQWCSKGVDSRSGPLFMYYNSK